MTGRVKGKTAVVTAAAQGIGRATALALARDGARVFATDINEIALRALEKEHVGITARKLDVLNAEDIEAAADAIGAPEILVNCSGHVHHGTILDCGEDQWDLSFDMNVKAYYRIIKAFLPAMIRNRGASIVNVASVVSSIKGAPNRFAYGATKGAVVGMTKQLATDFVARKIRCNAVCPGTIDTPSLQERMRAQGDVNTARAAFMARQPIGRFGLPEEVANLIVYLGSDESEYVTGQPFVIDGGWTM
ncbi:MAG TPA: SDR family oxidoreductase [Aestuariivirgaceae bacterium]|nr:SDR family oxidoreductase [Aestuariivirgaceae bacterium]